MVNLIIHGFLSLIKEHDNLGLMSGALRAGQKQKLSILQGVYSRIKKKYLNIRKYINTNLQGKAPKRLFNLFNNFISVFNLF